MEMFTLPGYGSILEMALHSNNQEFPPQDGWEVGLILKIMLLHDDDLDQKDISLTILIALHILRWNLWGAEPFTVAQLPHGIALHTSFCTVLTILTICNGICTQHQTMINMHTCVFVLHVT